MDNVVTEHKHIAMRYSAPFIFRIRIIINDGQTSLPLDNESGPRHAHEATKGHRLKMEITMSIKAQETTKGHRVRPLSKQKYMPKMGSGKVFEWTEMENGKKKTCSHPDHHNTTNPSKPC
jgi:hypothetical protein